MTSVVLHAYCMFNLFIHAYSELPGDCGNHERLHSHAHTAAAAVSQGEGISTSSQEGDSHKDGPAGVSMPASKLSGLPMPSFLIGQDELYSTEEEDDEEEEAPEGGQAFLQQSLSPTLQAIHDARE